MKTLFQLMRRFLAMQKNLPAQSRADRKLIAAFHWFCSQNRGHQNRLDDPQILGFTPITDLWDDLAGSDLSTCLKIRETFRSSYSQLFRSLMALETEALMGQTPENAHSLDAILDYRDTLGFTENLLSGNLNSWVSRQDHFERMDGLNSRQTRFHCQNPRSPSFELELGFSNGYRAKKTIALPPLKANSFRGARDFLIEAKRILKTEFSGMASWPEFSQAKQEEAFLSRTRKLLRSQHLGYTAQQRQTIRENWSSLCP